MENTEIHYEMMVSSDIDEWNEKFFIPMCYGTIYTQDKEDCHCPDPLTFHSFEKKRFNDVLKAKNETIKAMESELKHLRKVIEKLKKIITMEGICERCEKDLKEVFVCEICEQIICEDCQAVYNQFTQIDFNCCQSCADTTNDQ